MAAFGCLAVQQCTVARSLLSKISILLLFQEKKLWIGQFWIVFGVKLYRADGGSDGERGWAMFAARREGVGRRKQCRYGERTQGPPRARARACRFCCTPATDGRNPQRPSLLDAIQDVSWHGRDDCDSECGIAKDTTVNRGGPRLLRPPARRVRARQRARQRARHCGTPPIYDADIPVRVDVCARLPRAAPRRDLP